MCPGDQLALIKYGSLELTAIVLFNPNRPNLIHRDVVKAEQQLYIYLLQRILNMSLTHDSGIGSRFGLFCLGVGLSRNGLLLLLGLMNDHFVGQ
ncbi:unnamed protein product, partial [Oppiella nova]